MARLRKAAAREEVSAAAVAGLPLTIVRDTFADGRVEYGARLVFVRPDQYIAWCGDTAPADIAGLLARSVGR